MDKIVLYGIPNCDTTKKALKWFKQHNLDVTFWDYKSSGITKEKLSAWCKKKSWDVLVNKRSTTWRELPVAEQAKITSEAAAINLMMTHTSIIKRRVIEFNDKLLTGFNETEITKQLK